MIYAIRSLIKTVTEFTFLCFLFDFFKEKNVKFVCVITFPIKIDKNIYTYMERGEVIPFYRFTPALFPFYPWNRVKQYEKKSESIDYKIDIKYLLLITHHAYLRYKFKEFYRNVTKYIVFEIKIIKVRGIPFCPMLHTISKIWEDAHF